MQVFVEVKARQTVDGSAMESVTRDKQRRLGRAAASWVVRNGQPARGNRFDVVTVEGRGSQAKVHHLRNAFETLGRFGV